MSEVTDIAAYRPIGFVNKPDPMGVLFNFNDTPDDVHVLLREGLVEGRVLDLVPGFEPIFSIRTPNFAVSGSAMGLAELLDALTSSLHALLEEYNG